MPNECCPISPAAVVGLLTLLGGSGVRAGTQLPGTLNFQNVTSSRIVETVPELAGNEKEVEFGDFDNDGDLDVVIANAHSNFDQRRNKLYRNDDGVFNEVSGAPIIAGFSDTTLSRNVFFRDYDGDGWLDIWIVNDGNSQGDRLYIAQTADGQFSHYVDETADRLPNPNTGASDGAVSIDADQDGDFDVYIGNEPNSSQDRMYFNDGAGIFTDVTSTHVPPEFNYSDDVAAADMNGDGKLDLLIANPPNFVYYNDNGRGSSGPGDFRYGPDGQAGVQPLGPGGTLDDDAMEPVDFDGDGRRDVYWLNKVGWADRILRNEGNDAANMAILIELPAATLPPHVLANLGGGTSAGDLNGDGRYDLIVTHQQARPAILRNTSVNRTISFVDWTPGNTFPNGTVHRAWHAALFDTNGDGDTDIFLGGRANDHLFEQVPASEYVEGDLVGGVIPNVYNQDPAAVLGSAIQGEADTYTINGLGTNAFISVVLNGPDDYRLEILDANDVVLMSVDRGGLGVEEAAQYDPPGSPTTLKLRITVLDCANAYDLDGDCTVGILDLLSLLAAWGPNRGHPADFNSDGTVGILDLLALLANWGGGANDYLLEVLSRS